MKAKAETGKNIDLTVKMCFAALGLERIVSLCSHVPLSNRHDLLDESKRDLDQPHDKVADHDLGRNFC